MFEVMVNPEPAVGDISGSEGRKTMCATPKVSAATTAATRPAHPVAFKSLTVFAITCLSLGLRLESSTPVSRRVGGSPLPSSPKGAGRPGCRAQLHSPAVPTGAYVTNCASTRMVRRVN
jgi:hypothetical protein